MQRELSLFLCTSKGDSLVVDARICTALLPPMIFDSGLWPNYLLLRRRAKLLGLACGESSRHVECLHDVHIARALVALKTTHKVNGEGHYGLNPVTQLTVT